MLTPPGFHCATASAARITERFNARLGGPQHWSTNQFADTSLGLDIYPSNKPLAFIGFNIIIDPPKVFCCFMECGSCFWIYAAQGIFLRARGQDVEYRSTLENRSLHRDVENKRRTLVESSQQQHQNSTACFDMVPIAVRAPVLVYPCFRSRKKSPRTSCSCVHLHLQVSKVPTRLQSINMCSRYKHRHTVNVM